MATPMNIQISGCQTAMTSIQLTAKSGKYEATRKNAGCEQFEAASD